MGSKSDNKPPLLSTISSYAAALWLIAKGWEPQGAEVEPESGSILFLFDWNCADDWNAYHDAKKKLDRLQRLARLGGGAK